MKRHLWIAVAVAAVAGLALGYWLRGPGGGGEVPGAAPEGEGSVARVETVPLARERIEETLTVYGTVVPAPGKELTVSVPFESRVSRVMAAVGQVIAAGSPLLEIEPSPDAALELAQAQADAAAAQRERNQVQQRFELKLTTVEDVAQAESRLEQARARYESLRKRDMGKRELRAEAAGMVTRVNVQPGDIVPAGAVLAATVGRDQLSVRLGVETEDQLSLHDGQTVGLYPVNAPSTGEISGRITVIGRQVNPETRMVDVFATPAAGAPLLLNEYVRGTIVAAAENGLVAPRAAVLPEQGGYVIFLVEGGHAHKHEVKLGLENDQKVQLLGEGFQEGQAAVVQGVSQLIDGMTVEAGPAR